MKLTNPISLLGVQPYLKYADSRKQWEYYENFILDYIKKQQTNQYDFPIIVTLPEYALGNVRKSKIDESLIDELKDLISDFTRTNNLTLIGGSFAIKEREQYKNRLLIWDNKGKVVSMYDKKYLFNFEKKSNFSPGTHQGLVRIYDLIKIKVLICSDLWYPEEIRVLLKEDINLIFVPAMSVVPEKNKIPYGRWLWHSLAITRARENVIPVIVSDWAVQNVGKGPTWTCGASSIIDPSIRWTNESEYEQAFTHFKNGQEGIISSVIDLEKVNEYKKYRQDVGLFPV